MKRIILILIFVTSTLYAETKVIPFENGTSYLDTETGDVRIEYSDGNIFIGTGNPEKVGYPLFGILRNDEKHIWYEGQFDENENYTGTAYLETDEEIYEGEFKDGQKNGQGVLYNKKTKDKYEGSFLNDKKDGEGILYNDETGYYYSGHWEKGNQNGFGTLITESDLSYVGEFKDGDISGHGEMTTTSGEKTIANWLPGGIPEGEDCTYIGTDGSKYHGEIVAGKFEGYGTYIDKEGNYYEGSFCGNQRTGYGTQIYKSGGKYSGYFYSNQRNGNGSFKIDNFEYTGGFEYGNFYNSGSLWMEENNEYTIIASDVWDGNKLPQKGKILFSDGDMYEGNFDNEGYPIAGKGIWTTREERLARQSQPNVYVSPVIYYKDNQVYDLSSVYNEYEVAQIIQSVSYLRTFKSFYDKHKKTIDSIVTKTQMVAGILAVIPSPIQPIAAVIDIGLSVAQISLKTVSTSIDIYDATVAGNINLIPNMIKDYGKDIAWDALNIFLSIPGAAGKTLQPLGSKVATGFNKAGEKIGKITAKALQKNQHLAHAALHLEQLIRYTKASGKMLVEAFDNSKYFKYVAENGGKLTKTLKTNWIKTVYPKLFKEYGDDATELIFKYGNEIAEQLGKNGDLIVKTSSKYGDDVARVFLKDGDNIAKIARKSPYPESTVKYISDSVDTAKAIKLTEATPKVGKFINDYGDDVIPLLEKYGDDVIPLLDRHGKSFTEAMKKTLPDNQQALFELFKKNPDVIAKAYSKYGEKTLYAFKVIGKKRHDILISAINKNGDEMIDIINKIPKQDAARTVEFLDTFDSKLYKTYNNGLPEEITSQVIRDSRDNQILYDSVAKKLKNKNTQEAVSFVKHDERYINTKTQELKKNIVYRTGEGNYYYMTDQAGRTVRAQGNLRLKKDLLNIDENFRGKWNSNTPNKLPGDDAGHIIADIFGGSGELDNLVSQLDSINRSTWKKMENNWVKALTEGKDVHVDIEIVYDGISKRPSSFIVTQTINGVKTKLEPFYNTIKKMKNAA